MRIVVLGGGSQGRVIASDLALGLPRATIQVAGLEDPGLPGYSNLAFIRADLSDQRALVSLIAGHDLAVGALPSRLGFAAQRGAITAKRNLIDVSLAAQDPMVLDTDAQAAGVTIVPDCGFDPGLSNLVVGHAIATGGAPEEITVMAGGFALDRNAPYGYVVTRPLDDLADLYTRPARILREGRTALRSPFTGVEEIEIDGLGALEAFHSDGLRSMLQTLEVPAMDHKTLGWPGHAAALAPLAASGQLADELRQHCSADPPYDVVALVVRVRRGGDVRKTVLVERRDPKSRRTAMVRTTASTAVAIARLAEQRGLGPPGVRPLELLGQDEKTYRFVVEALEGSGITLAGEV